MAAEEFQGGVCGGTLWNHDYFSGCGGGASGFVSPCSVAQLGGGGGGGGGGYDMGSFVWPDEIVKGKSSNDQVCNSLIFPSDMECTFDILGFGLSPTSSTIDWNQQNFYKRGRNEENIESMEVQENLSSRLNYGMEENSATMMNSNNFLCNINNHQDESPPITLSNSSGDSSTLTYEGGGLTPNFTMSSSASYLIQTLFDDDDTQLEPHQHISQSMSQVIDPNDFSSMNTSNNNELVSPCSWVKSSMCDDLPVQPHHQPPRQCDKFDNGGMNGMLVNGPQGANNQYNTAAALSNIRVSLMNSLQSRSRATAYKQKSPNCAPLSTKRNHEDSKKNMNNNDQATAKRPRIETPSSLPTFKVRKEKLGDRITALQQLVSPFGKTDTASVLHEAIEYIKFLHDQVHVLCNPYLKNGAAVQHHEQISDKLNDNEETHEQDLRGRGLCLVPISSTYPVAQETPVDFWTPTFGGATFR